MDEETLRDLLTKAASGQGLAVDPDFLFDEWTLIVDAWNVKDAESYKELPRLGRKVRMAASRREALWTVFDAVRSELEEKGLKTEAMLAHKLRYAGAFPFDHAIVDEAQDISVAELMLLGSALGSAKNGLFFAGDIGQRIFRAPFPWAAAGVDVRGRSRSLKVNYRTSHQIRLRSDLLLPETLVEADGSEEGRLGVTSVFDGPVPQIHRFQDPLEEIEALAEWTNWLSDQGVANSEIAVLVRHDNQVKDLKSSLGAGVRVMPMHDAKGAEFRAVAVALLNHDVLPDEGRLLAARDEGQLDEVMSTERHLLYVAATRARDFLWLSGVEPVSEFLSDLLEHRQ